MIVFTNGCFDVIHPGHIELLAKARKLGSKLIVGLNGDASVRSLKGPGRPLQTAAARKTVLLGLRDVDEVIEFDELTPERLIRDLRPDVLVKGGDWAVSDIVGADFVRSYGGEVHSIPLKAGFSTSSIVESINSSPTSDLPSTHNGPVSNSLKEHQRVFADMEATLADDIVRCAQHLSEVFRAGRKVLICGNGGSAADAQHLAAEFVGRYEKERQALPAIALTTDTSALTALSNDYDFDSVFSRQVEALASAGDCLVALSTSGTSRNILNAVMAARSKECSIISLTGAKGKTLAGLSDLAILVPATRTARIQEAHITIAHIWCEIIEEGLNSK